MKKYPLSSSKLQCLAALRRDSRPALLSLLFLLLSVLLLSSCNSNDDVLTDDFLGTITIDGDTECCSADEARIVFNIVKNLHEVTALRDTIQGTYSLHAYTTDGTFRVGYNDIYFVVTKLKNGNYVKDFSISQLTPLMTMNMNGKTMQHYTPILGDATTPPDAPQALKHTWISFLMPSTDADKWQLSYNINIQKHGEHELSKSIAVAALPEGQAWLKSFKAGDTTYYLSLVSPDKWQTGSNAIQTYVSKKSSPATSPYLLAEEEFTIDIDPRMPDMGNHTSPDNESLTKQSTGDYQGIINLTMTGLWRIYLTVRDKEGNIVAGEGNSLYWDVTI